MIVNGESGSMILARGALDLLIIRLCQLSSISGNTITRISTVARLGGSEDYG